MDESDKLIIELIARTDRLERGLDRAGRTSEQKLSAIEGRARVFASRFSSLLGAVSAGALVAALAKVADEAKGIDATLKLATASFGSFGKATDDVRGIAERTRSGLKATADLYATFARNGKELGLTQAEVARATETFAQTLKVSGASASEAEAATTQFAQALASGVLRGDEFNSIMEASPRLSRLLADSLGVPIGSLRAMAEQGELTADKLTKALTDKKITSGLQGEFDQLPVTFDQAMQRVYDAGVITFGAFDRGGEFSTMIANFVVDGSDGFTQLEDRAERFGIELRSQLEGLRDAFNPMLEGGEAIIDILKAKFAELREATGFQGLMTGMGIDSTDIGATRNGLRATDQLRNIGPKLYSFLGGDGDKYRSDALGAFDRRQREVAGSRTAAMETRKLQDRWGFKPGAVTAADISLGATPGEGVKPPVKPPSATELKKQQQEAAKAARDVAAFKRDEASLTESIARAQADILVNVEDRAAAELQISAQAKQAAVDEISANTRLNSAQRDRLIKLVGLKAAVDDAKTIMERDVAIAKDALDTRLATLKNDRDILSAQGDLAETREERLAVEKRILAKAYEEERLQLQGILAAKDATRGDKQRAQDRLNALGALEQADQGGVDRRFESPLQRYNRSLGDTSISDQVEDLVGQELDYFRDSMRNSITKQLGIKDPLLAGIIDMFIQQAIIRPIANALANSAGGGGGGGLLGSVVSGLSAALAPGRASGGYVGPGQLVRVNESAAPGRVEGFRPTGSGEVIPLGRMAAAQRGGRGPTTINQSFDLRGAVVTEELYADLERRSIQNGAIAGAAMGSQSGTAAMKQASRPRLPGSLG